MVKVKTFILTLLHSEIVYNFGLSECNRVITLLTQYLCFVLLPDAIKKTHRYVSTTLAKPLIWILTHLLVSSVYLRSFCSGSEVSESLREVVSSGGTA